MVDIGTILLNVESNKLKKISFSNEKSYEELTENNFTKQIIEYLKGKRKFFDFEVELKGGPVFLKIWNYVRKIPYGETMTYGEVAKVLNLNPRIIGFAMKANLLPIYIPCHRVVGKNDIGGFSGGIKWKKFLLELEKKYIR
ncbi:cysteine methyltransferase [Thermosipho melanesiensis]|nr:cysteine methyltransferase [Thermosipho melanesiensis]OOC36935.1 cysteine methyltransferase [Thermosipho melanesiensis]OOC37686.1 cysteine methyltransferase [Thermosipho melanesiensis]OOC40915.1 cysteine methyltransferase [Thermosipho melanesiensis]OOC42909.1 cysteine methyltransferase [Thermosipho melanesiensis]